MRINGLEFIKVPCRGCGVKTTVRRDWKKTTPKADLCFACWEKNNESFDGGNI